MLASHQWMLHQCSTSMNVLITLSSLFPFILHNQLKNVTTIWQRSTWNMMLKDHGGMLCNDPLRYTRNLLAQALLYKQCCTLGKNIQVPQITACFAFSVISLLKHAISPPAFFSFMTQLSSAVMESALAGCFQLTVHSHPGSYIGNGCHLKIANAPCRVLRCSL